MMLWCHGVDGAVSRAKTIEISFYCSFTSFSRIHHIYVYVYVYVCVCPNAPQFSAIHRYPNMDDAATEALRVSLWTAVNTRDFPTLAKLCMEHEATIERAFMEQWRVIPPAIRGDPALINVYGTSLVAIARHFKTAFGKMHQFIIISVCAHQ